MESKQNVGGKGAKPSRLGRGLSSLMSIDVPVTVEPVDNEPAQESAAGFTRVRVDAVGVSPFQPRKVMDEGSISRLADSIRRQGMMQPIVVRPVDGLIGRYELVAGERRWRAAKLASLEMVPALIKALSDEEAAEWALVENVQREDLNAMERAWALRGLADKFGLTQQTLAERVGLERSSVANLMRLTELEGEIQGMIAAGKLSAGHGKALLSHGAGPSRVALARTAAVGEMPVRRLEALAKRAGDAALAAAKDPLPGTSGRLAVVQDLERQLSQQLGTKVKIAASKGAKRGVIKIEFYGVDHFDGLLARLGLKAV